MKKSLLFYFSMLMLFNFCKNESSNSGQNTEEKSAILTLIETPSQSGGEPNLFAGKDGFYLSWVEYINDTTDALWFSKLTDNQWNKPIEIAQSSNWFVNWADFPSLVSYGDGQHLAAHWLQKSAAGTYDYDVHVSQSNDGGESWSPSFVLHKDGISAEHGFVTMIPQATSRIFATWLDGRNTKTGDSAGHDDHGHGHGGAMSLRGAFFDNNGLSYMDSELDHRICDCCQTDAAMTDQGPIVVYRDRSAEEIRDIYIVRNVEGKWTEPKAVFNDNWKIAGCPVNGPAVAVTGNQVVVAWYGMVDNKAQVKVAFSKDGGANFSAPIQVDEGHPLGRVDIVMKDGKALVTWLETQEDKTFVKLAEVTQQGVSEKHILKETSAARNSGFPILEQFEKQLVLAWTEVDDAGETKVETGLVNL